MDRIVLTCNSVTIQLCAAQFINRCRMFMSPFGKPHMGNPPQSIPYWDVTDWFSVSSERMFFIKTGIYRLLFFETIVPHLNNSPMVPVGAILTYCWPLSPLGFLFRITRSSSVALRKTSHGPEILRA